MILLCLLYITPNDIQFTVIKRRKAVTLDI